MRDNFHLAILQQRTRKSPPTRRRQGEKEGERKTRAERARTSERAASKDRNAEPEKRFHYRPEKGHDSSAREGRQGAREKRDSHVMTRSRVDNGLRP